MPAGQPTLLTPQVIEDVRRLLPTVMYFESVGDYLGVSRITWRGWLKRGAREDRRLQRHKARSRPRESLYLEFFYACKKAISEGEIYDAGTIKKAAAVQWTAAAWRLERRFPERWGRRDAIDHTVRAKLKIKHEHRFTDDQRVEALAGLYARLGREPGAAIANGHRNGD